MRSSILILFVALSGMTWAAPTLTETGSWVAPTPTETGCKPLLYSHFLLTAHALLLPVGRVHHPLGQRPRVRLRRLYVPSVAAAAFPCRKELSCQMVMLFIMLNTILMCTRGALDGECIGNQVRARGCALDGWHTQRLALVHRCRGGRARRVHCAFVVRERGTTSRPRFV
jgi:hypothetical protein